MQYNSEEYYRQYSDVSPSIYGIHDSTAGWRHTAFDINRAAHRISVGFWMLTSCNIFAASLMVICKLLMRFICA